MMHHL